METHEIEIEVRPDGTVRAHVRGAKGTGCLEYAKLLEQLLGTKGEVQHTSEFYEEPTSVAIRLETRTSQCS